MSARCTGVGSGEQAGAADTHVQELAGTNRKALGRRPRQLELVARLLLLCSSHLLAEHALNGKDRDADGRCAPADCMPTACPRALRTCKGGPRLREWVVGNTVC